MPVISSASDELLLSTKGYTIIEMLGSGSFSKVYLATFTSLNSKRSSQVLACKIINTSKAPRDYTRKFLPRELEFLKMLHHPHIIHIHSIYQRKNKYYIFMRYAEQGDLVDFITKKGALKENRARVWARQLALAIKYLHRRDIAHRDLKCENALITNNYNIKLADFGFARYLIDPASGTMAMSETYCGSLSYVAPEILLGQPYNAKIGDMWSFGVVLYVMLNRSMPFDDFNQRKLYEQQVKKKWRFRSKYGNIVSDDVKTVIGALLEPNIQERLTVDQFLNSCWLQNDPRLYELAPEGAEELQEKGEPQFDDKDTDSKKQIRTERTFKVIKTVSEDVRISININKSNMSIDNAEL